MLPSEQLKKAVIYPKVSSCPAQLRKERISSGCSFIIPSAGWFLWWCWSKTNTVWWSHSGCPPNHRNAQNPWKHRFSGPQEKTPQIESLTPDCHRRLHLRLWLRQTQPNSKKQLNSINGIQMGTGVNCQSELTLMIFWGWWCWCTALVQTEISKQLELLDGLPWGLL